MLSSVLLVTCLQGCGGRLQEFGQRQFLFQDGPSQVQIDAAAKAAEFRRDNIARFRNGGIRSGLMSVTTDADPLGWLAKARRTLAALKPGEKNFSLMGQIVAYECVIVEMGKQGVNQVRPEFINVSSDGSRYAREPAAEAASRSCTGIIDTAPLPPGL